MWQKIKNYGIGIAIPLAVGGLAAFITRNSMDIYDKINQPFFGASILGVPGRVDDSIYPNGNKLGDDLSQ